MMVMVGGTNCRSNESLLEADVTGDGRTISSFQIVASGFGAAGTTGSLAFTFQKIEFDDKRISNLGTSTLMPDIGATGERRLPVSNLGSSGQDGVSVDLGK